MTFRFRNGCVNVAKFPSFVINSAFHRYCNYVVGLGEGLLATARERISTEKFLTLRANFLANCFFFYNCAAKEHDRGKECNVLNN